MDQEHKSIPNLDYTEGSSVVDIHSSVSREKSEPKAGLEPVSIWTFIAGALVLAAAALYLGAHSGGFNMDNPFALAYTEEDMKRPVIPGAIVEVDNRPWIEKWMESGRKVYGTCAACHTPTGAGQPAAGFPPLDGSEWVTAGTEQLGMIIMNGLEGPITVQGQQYGTTGVVMAAQGTQLSPKEMAQVMTYVRRSWSNDASVVTEEMAKVIYEKYSSRTTAWTVEDIRATVGQDDMLPGAEVDLETGLPPGQAPEGEAADGDAP